MAKNERVTSPKGIANYPHLNQPDTKFNDDGEYKVNLVVEDSKELDAFVNKLEAILEDFVATDDRCKKEGSKLNVNKVCEVNDEGASVFKFKQKAIIRTRDGKTIEKKVALFDGHAKKMDDLIGYGSVIKVCCDPYPYYVPANKRYNVPPQAGLSLRLVAVQVLELKSGGEGDSGEAYGFGEEEGAYEATSEATSMGFESEEADEYNEASNF